MEKVESGEDEECDEQPQVKKIAKVTCPICCELCNNSSRKPITCFACPSMACAQCLCRYILTLPGEARCMGCKTKWDRAFMLKTFTLKFAKGDYKKHLESYFIDREKALMPETQAKITRRLELDALRDEKSLLYSKITEVARQLKKIERSNTQAKSSSMIVSVDDLKKVMAELLAKIDAVNDALQDSPTNRRAAERKFIRACPSDCRGFLNTDWVCGLCSTHVCSKCHEIKAHGGSINHKCLKSNVATAALLAKDTKPCPKCAAQIFQDQRM